MRTPLVILTLLFASLLLIAGCGGERGLAPKETAPATTTTASALPPVASLTITNSAGEGVPVRVEVAATKAAREKGLMGRTALAEDGGMLFLFDRPATASFWMKDTLIPLSIAFIAPQGRIIDIQDMQPLAETQHTPAAPYQGAIEV